MEKKKGKVDDVKEEKEEGDKKEDESDPTPSVGLFELVKQIKVAAFLKSFSSSNLPPPWILFSSWSLSRSPLAVVPSYQSSQFFLATLCR